MWWVTGKVFSDKLIIYIFQFRASDKLSDWYSSLNPSNLDYYRLPSSYELPFLVNTVLCGAGGHFAKIIGIHSARRNTRFKLCFVKRCFDLGWTNQCSYATVLVLYFGSSRKKFHFELYYCVLSIKSQLKL